MVDALAITGKRKTRFSWGNRLQPRPSAPTPYSRGEFTRSHIAAIHERSFRRISYALSAIELAVDRGGPARGMSPIPTRIASFARSGASFGRVSDHAAIRALVISFAICCSNRCSS